MRPWHGNRKYGELAPKPQAIWQDKKTRWRNVAIDVRGKMRHLRVHVSGPFLRKGAAECPLMLIVVKGKHRRGKRAYRRQAAALFGECGSGCGGTLELTSPFRYLALLGVATLGSRSRSP